MPTADILSNFTTTEPTTTVRNLTTEATKSTAYKTTEISTTQDTVQPSTPAAPAPSDNKVPIIIGVLVPLLLIAAGVALFCFIRWRRAHKKDQSNKEKQPKIFSKTTSVPESPKSPEYADVNVESPYYSEAENKKSFKTQESLVYDEVGDTLDNKKIPENSVHGYIEILPDSPEPKSNPHYIEMNKGEKVKYSGPYGLEYYVSANEPQALKVEPKEGKKEKLTREEKEKQDKIKLGLTNSDKKDTLPVYVNVPKKVHKPGLKKFFKKKKSKDVIEVEKIKSLNSPKVKEMLPFLNSDSSVNAKHSIKTTDINETVTPEVMHGEGEDYINIENEPIVVDEHKLNVQNEKTKGDRLSHPIHDVQHYANVEVADSGTYEKDYVNMSEEKENSEGEDYENVQEKLKPKRKIKV